MDIDPKSVTIGQWADYLDTGIWDMTSAGIVSPVDLTISQLRDFLRVSGGAVYLGKDERFVWIP